MNFILKLVILYLVFVTIAYSQPVLTATNTQGELAKFYVITIDGTEMEPVLLELYYNYAIFEDLFDLGLTDGTHEILLRVGNDLDESDDLKFFINITRFENSDLAIYEIQPDPDNNDPNYLLKFGENLIAEVDEITGEVFIPEDTNDYTDGGGGGGGGCFIEVISR